ncbi:hypothetical protein DdX_18489 [Ditylenchus destructor]|uniref:Uncharacterized protein n=1 Tax=Ditylenchus destructor TaxID=166010 RepID=A0AAD4QY18_9BILA|nr:hypothetical protein DdX_18489 [Ditylenchus destructor]
MTQIQKLTRKLTPSIETVCIVIAAAFILSDAINIGNQWNTAFLSLVYLVDLCTSVGMIVASCTGKSKLYLPFIVFNVSPGNPFLEGKSLLGFFVRSCPLLAVTALVVVVVVVVGGPPRFL